MLLSFYNKSYSPHVFDAVIKRYKKEQVSKKGVISYVSTITECNNAELISPFNSFDFSVSNLQAIGANNILNSRYLGSLSTLSMCDSLEPSPKSK